jgi:hypothetical protein
MQIIRNPILDSGNVARPEREWVFGGIPRRVPAARQPGGQGGDPQSHRDGIVSGPAEELAGELAAIHAAATAPGGHQRVQPPACDGVEPRGGLSTQPGGHRRDGAVDDRVQTPAEVLSSGPQGVAAIVGGAVRTGAAKFRSTKVPIAA